MSIYISNNISKDISKDITKDITKSMSNDLHEIIIGIPIEKPKKNTFILKVLFYLLCQFILTTSITITAYYFKHTFYITICTNINLSILITTFILSIISLSCYKTNNIILLHILFSIFTLTSALLAAVSILPYYADTLILSVIGTTLCIIFVSLYVLYCNLYDNEIIPYGGSMISVSASILPLLIVQIFVIKNNSTFPIFISILIMTIFILHLMYDLEKLYQSQKLNIFDHPIYPAINIYLDIINVFFCILQLFNNCNENCSE